MKYFHLAVTLLTLIVVTCNFIRSRSDTKLNTRLLRRIIMTQEELNALEASIGSKVDALGSFLTEISNRAKAEAAQIAEFIANAPDELDTSGLIALNDKLSQIEEKFGATATDVTNIFTPQTKPADPTDPTFPVDPVDPTDPVDPSFPTGSPIDDPVDFPDGGTTPATPVTPVVTADGPVDFAIGGSVTLSSDAVAGNQWSKDGTKIDGETNASLTVKEAGSYTVVATNDDGVASSDSEAVVVTVT